MAARSYAKTVWRPCDARLLLVGTPSQRVSVFGAACQHPLPSPVRRSKRPPNPAQCRVRAGIFRAIGNSVLYDG